MKSQIFDDNSATEGSDRLHHLATAESRGNPICGDDSPDAPIGSYFEHLDDKNEFIREVYAQGRKPVRACPRCLALYPSISKIGRDERELKRITPFSLQVNVAFRPDASGVGYDVFANGIAKITDKRVYVDVAPQLTFTTAMWIYSLQFGLSINAPLIVPLINQANKDK